MIVSIKPKLIELFPGSVSVNRCDINTTAFTKDVSGVRITYNLQCIEIRDWHQPTVDPDTGELVDVVTQSEHVAYSDFRSVLLTPEQWANWTEGDSDADDIYICDCVLTNTGLERA